MRVWRIIITSLLVSGCSPTIVHSSGEALTQTPGQNFTSAPTLTVSNATPAPLEVITFSATGGVPPYTYFLASGDGTLDSASLSFTAGSAAGVVQLGVTDSAGFSGYANVNVVVPTGGGTTGGALALSVTPTTATIEPDSTLTFAASGGTGPYTLAITSGTGSVSGLTFQASPTQGSVTLVIQDSASHSVTASVNVQSSVPATQGSASFSITVDQYLAFTFDNNSGADNPYFGFVGTGPSADATSQGQFEMVTLGNYSNAKPSGVAYRGTITATGRTGSASVEFCIPPVHKGYAFVRAVSGAYSFKTLVFNQTAQVLFEGSQATTAFLNLDTASGSGTVSVTLSGGYSGSVDCSDYDGTQYVDVGQQ
jgi:hypothetical protein